MTVKEIITRCDRIESEIDRTDFSTATIAADRMKFWMDPAAAGLLSDEERADVLQWWTNQYNEVMERARRRGLYIAWVPEDTENLL